jgi:cob(I)alamin adenosyltransferase
MFLLFSPEISMEPSSITTGTGDRGKTGLFGGKRIAKDSSRLHAYGTIDELNAILGVVFSENALPDDMQVQLLEIQKILFRVGTDLATPLDSSVNVARIEQSDVRCIEKKIALMEEVLPPLQKFILPSGSKMGALLHQARTVCRRAERWVVALQKEEKINSELPVYLNRLSDYLFLTARAANKFFAAPETEM